MLHQVVGGGVAVTCDPWDVIVDPACCPSWSSTPESVRDTAVALATDTLWALSGRRFGICQVCVRPCNTVCFTCGNQWTPPGMWGVRSGLAPYVNSEGQWFNGGCGCGGAASCCQPACAVWLDPAPATEIVQVKINGLPVVGGFQVVNGNLLVRAPGSGCWPDCNDLTLPDTAAGTWSIVYKHGLKPPLGGRRAAGVLACELAKRCMGQKCRLPANVTQLSRDGVSLTLDPKAFLDVGLTLLPEVNDWLRQVNPYGLHQPADVWSPDITPPPQIVWPAGVC